MAQGVGSEPDPAPLPVTPMERQMLRASARVLDRQCVVCEEPAQGAGITCGRVRCGETRALIPPWRLSWLLDLKAAEWPGTTRP